jgi:hypothetical protein
VQSAISAFATQDMVVIDREAAVTFANQREKAQLTQRLARPLHAAVAHPNGTAWWRAKPSNLGGECDALAVTPEGDLLTIEIKPAKATGTITWAPLQVRHYANLFTAWVEQDSAKAAVVIQGMIDQRVQLGLVRDLRPRVSPPIRVRPVIAISRGYSRTALVRLAEVQQRLIAADLNDPPLTLASVNLAGRLDAIER